MIRVLLKHTGTKDTKGCQRDAEKIFRIAISVKAASSPSLSIVSRKEIELEENMNKKIQKGNKASWD